MPLIFDDLAEVQRTKPAEPSGDPSGGRLQASTGTGLAGGRRAARAAEAASSAP